MVGVTSSGNFNNIRAFINRVIHRDVFSDLDRYGQMGVDALSSATPVDTGISAQSWGYRLVNDGLYTGIEWYNTHVTVSGTPVVILIQYGHGTGTGGYVVGRDFINPAIQPIFDQIADDIWEKVIS